MARTTRWGAEGWRAYSLEMQRRWERACSRADWDAAMTFARMMALTEVRARHLERAA